MSNEKQQPYMSKQQTDVLEFIKNKKEVSQSEIVDHYLESFNYKNRNNARASISRILTKLKSIEYIDYRQEKNDGSGGIYKNIWFVK